MAGQEELRRRNQQFTGLWVDAACSHGGDNEKTVARSIMTIDRQVKENPKTYLQPPLCIFTDHLVYIPGTHAGGHQRQRWQRDPHHAASRMPVTQLPRRLARRSGDASLMIHRAVPAGGGGAYPAPEDAELATARPSARKHRPLPRFTLAGANTRAGQITGLLRTFWCAARWKPYSLDEAAEAGGTRTASSPEAYEPASRSRALAQAKPLDVSVFPLLRRGWHTTGSQPMGSDGCGTRLGRADRVSARAITERLVRTRRPCRKCWRRRWRGSRGCRRFVRASPRRRWLRPRTRQAAVLPAQPMKHLPKALEIGSSKDNGQQSSF